MTLIPQTSRSFFNQLTQHSQQRNLAAGRAVHARILRSGASSCIFIANSLVNLYAKCGHLSKAQIVFDAIADKDIVSWNCLINGFSQNGGLSGSRSVMRLFRRMRSENVLPNAHSLAGIFSAEANLGGDSVGKQTHAFVVKTTGFSDVYVGSSMVNMYCKAGMLEDARKVFDRMPERNSFSWATMISGYAAQRLAEEAIGLFKLLLKEEKESETEFAFTSVLSALAAPEYVDIGRKIHGLAVKNGMLEFVPVGNALVTMYSKCGSLIDACRTFGLSGGRDSITWSAMITGYAQNGDYLQALKLFSSMFSYGVKPSAFTLVGVLNACSDIGYLEEAKQIHSYLLKLGYEAQLYVITALVDVYAKCSSVADARKGFDYLEEPDTALWTSMISGYAQNSENEDALVLYSRMQIEGILPNELTMASVLKSCSSLAALELGKQIHGQIIKHGFGLEIPIGSALSTMYAKCGNQEDGNIVFRRMPKRDIISWNAMISGLSQNGHGDKALELFEEMLAERTEPDYVTFVNILSACSHMGFVERGWYYFNMMSDQFRLVPKVEHYACMVDLLSRAGRVEEAKEFIESATIDHGMCLWRILLSACKNSRNYELGAYAGEKLMLLGSQESSAYVLLSSIYTALGRSEDVERVMGLMRSRSVSKEPGCSWVELKNQVHVFVVGDLMHPRIGEIKEEIRKLSRQMKEEGYRSVLDSSSVRFCGSSIEEVMEMSDDSLIESLC